MGDGYLTNKSSVACSLAMGQVDRHKDFVDYVATSLRLEHSVYEVKPKSYWKAKVKNSEFRYYSRTYPFLLSYLDRWYGSGSKDVPDDFKLTPISALFWFLGDGSNHYGKSIRLSTCSFSKKGISILVDELSRFGVHSGITRRNEIYIRNQSHTAFLSMVGNCHVGSFKYKWAVDSSEVEHRLTEECKKEIIKLYQTTNLSTRDIGGKYGYSSVAIARLLRLSIPKDEYKKLVKIRYKSRSTKRV